MAKRSRKKRDRQEIDGLDMESASEAEVSEAELPEVSEAEPEGEVVEAPSVEPVEVVPTPVRVELRNRLRHTVYVPTGAGTLRLGPRASTVLDAENVTEGTRRLEDAGRIHIRNL